MEAIVGDEWPDGREQTHNTKRNRVFHVEHFLISLHIIAQEMRTMFHVEHFSNRVKCCRMFHVEHSDLAAPK
jgi:hypothetical protein